MHLTIVVSCWFRLCHDLRRYFALFLKLFTIFEYFFSLFGSLLPLTNLYGYIQIIREFVSVFISVWWRPKFGHCSTRRFKRHINFAIVDSLLGGCSVVRLLRTEKTKSLTWKIRLESFRNMFTRFRLTFHHLTSSRFCVDYTAAAYLGSWSDRQGKHFVTQMKLFVFNFFIHIRLHKKQANTLFWSLYLKPRKNISFVLLLASPYTPTNIWGMGEILDPTDKTGNTVECFKAWEKKLDLTVSIRCCGVRVHFLSWTAASFVQIIEIQRGTA